MMLQVILGLTYDRLIVFTFLLITLLLGLWAGRGIIAPHIVHFNTSITMGDVMGNLYGANSKIITGLLGFFTGICVVGLYVVCNNGFFLVDRIAYLQKHEKNIG